MSKFKLFVVSVPFATGISEYDTNVLLKGLPDDLKPVDRLPSVSITASEIFFTWRCQRKGINTLIINSPVDQTNVDF